MTCTGILWNGAQTIGSMIIQPPQETQVPTKYKIITTALPAVDRGTKRPNFAAVRRGFGLLNLMLRNMLGFGWFVVLLSPFFNWNKLGHSQIIRKCCIGNGRKQMYNCRIKDSA